MNKKRLLGLILFACFITGCLFLSADLLMQQGSNNLAAQNQTFTAETKYTQDDDTKVAAAKENSSETTKLQNDSEEQPTGESSFNNLAEENGNEQKLQEALTAKGQNGTVTDDIAAEPWVSADPASYDSIIQDNAVGSSQGEEGSSESDIPTADTYGTLVNFPVQPQLITDCTQVDYLSYLPEIITDNELETALNISNPSISIDAEAAILFDADTKEVLYHKNAVEAVFPASTAKLLTSLVALDWCREEEEITLGDEIKMIASDSTRAYLHIGQVLTFRNLLEGMLLPSGNDAAYAIAIYVGRKSLQNPYIAKEYALTEFIRLMNLKAKKLGVKNSSFKTPDGYDAIGQYTTAYDMGLIGIAAAQNEIITDITKESRSPNIFASGEEVTWTNTNRLVTRYSGQYYSYAIGLKTGTSTMAGRCLVAAAEVGGKTVVCAIMDSTSSGRWEDAIELLKFGLN